MSINNDFLSSISIFYGGGNLKRRICVSIPPLSVHLPSRFINPNHIGTQKNAKLFSHKKVGTCHKCYQVYFDIRRMREISPLYITKQKLDSKAHADTRFFNKKTIFWSEPQFS